MTPEIRYIDNHTDELKAYCKSEGLQYEYILSSVKKENGNEYSVKIFANLKKTFSKFFKHRNTVKGIN